MGHYLHHGSNKSLGEGFIKMSSPQSVREGSYKDLVVRMDGLDNHIIELGEILP